jgi:TatD DNase family protein
MNYWVDTHNHIYLPDFDDDRTEVLSRCKEILVNRIYLPNIDHSSIDAMLEVEQKFPDLCVAMMGLHPCSVKADFEKELYRVEYWLSKRTFAAVGEMGTDLYWDKSFWNQQQEAFKIQVSWAKQYGLPIVIHCRDSLDQTLDMLEPLLDGKLRGIFHCFSGSLEQAKRIVQVGFLLGIGGVATFKNGGLDKVLPEIDLSNIVLETDSPYLAPVPHRGKRNSPLYLPLIAERVAALKNVPLEAVRAITTRNAHALFNPISE